MPFRMGPSCNCCGPNWANPVACSDSEGCCASGADNMPDQVTIDFSAGTVADANCDACDSLNAEFTLDIQGASSPYNCFYRYHDPEFCAAPSECTGADCSSFYELYIEAYLYRDYGASPDTCYWVVDLLLTPDPNTYDQFDPAHRDCSSTCRSKMVQQTASWSGDTWVQGYGECDKTFPVDVGDGYGGYGSNGWYDDGSVGCDGEPPDVCVIEGVVA